MFTGIVEELGSVVAIDRVGDSARFTVRGPVVVADATHGASIAVNGVCLTVVEHDNDAFSVDVMAESLARTSLGALAVGDPVPRRCLGAIKPDGTGARPARHDVEAGIGHMALEPAIKPYAIVVVGDDLCRHQLRPK